VEGREFMVYVNLNCSPIQPLLVHMLQSLHFEHLQCSKLEQEQL
jgi:hypothetical protein